MFEVFDHRVAGILAIALEVFPVGLHGVRQRIVTGNFDVEDVEIALTSARGAGRGVKINRLMSEICQGYAMNDMVMADDLDVEAFGVLQELEQIVAEAVRTTRLSPGLSPGAVYVTQRVSREKRSSRRRAMPWSTSVRAGWS